MNSPRSSSPESERELHESERRYRSLIQHVQAGIVVHDGRGNVVTANPAAAELLGLTPEQLTGKTLADPQWHFLREDGTVLPPEEYPVRRVLTSRAPIHGALLGIQHPARDTAWVLVSADPDRDETGGIAQIIVSFVDVTERRRAEEATRETLHRYRLVFENSPVSLWEEDFSAVRARFEEWRRAGVTDIDAWFDTHPDAVQECAALARIVDVNRATLALHGAATKDELLAGLLSTFTPESFTTFREALVALWNGETEVRRDARVKTLAGEPRDVTMHFAVCPGAEATLSRVVVSLADITDRKQTERQLSLVSFALNRVNDLVGLLDPEARFCYVNEGASRALGYTTEELLRMSILDLTPTWSQATWAAHWQTLATDGAVTFENVLRCKDGRILPVEVSTNHFEYGGQFYNLALGRDITERQRIEGERAANLRFFESLDRIHRILQRATGLEEMMADALDAVLEIFDCDRAFLMYPCDPDAPAWGVPMERFRPEWPGASVRNREFPMDAEVARTLRELLASDHPLKFGPETDHPLPEDVAREFGFRSFMSTAIYPAIGKPWQFGIHQCSHARVWNPDEERLLLELGRRIADAISAQLSLRRLQESETRYRRIVDTAAEGIWAFGSDLNTTFVNARMADMLGYAPTEIIGRPMSDFIFPEDREDHEARMARRRQGASENFERRFRRKDGQAFWTAVAATPILDEEHRFQGSFAMHTDITERKAGEAALLHLNRELRAISDCNQALVRATDEHTLLQNVCRIICEEAGYPMAWVAYAESVRENGLHPVAWYGGDSDVVSATAGTVAERSTEIAAANAVRTGRIVVVQDLTGDVGIPANRKLAVERGYRSHIALPLKDKEGSTFGMLGIFCSEPDAFTPDEVRLLEELSADLAFGINTLRMRAERNRFEAMVMARLHLIRYSATHTLDELLEETLNETERLTGSLIGFYHFIEEDQTTLWLQNWSTRTKAEFCKAEGKGAHYPVSEGGVWTEAIRLRKVVIHNDYASLPNRKGMPPGHAPVVRELVVPVLRGERIMAILGVGNKPTDYTETDVVLVTALADQAWEITERKRAEEQLHQYQGHLEETIEQRTAELMLARDAAEAANKAKSLFLANMSHELRTPLNAILGFSSLMHREPGLPPAQRENLEIINRSGEHLLTLINDVLEMAKIEAGRLQLETTPFDLAGMVRDVIEMMELRATEKGLKLTVEQSPDFPRFVKGDEARLRQILLNLVSNAVKFTRTGGVSVRMGVKPDRPDRVRIEVQDTGPGIAPEDQTRLFQPFVQLSDGSAHQGTGLGLSITRQFVQLMGGAIGLESTPGMGSLFWVELPVERARAADVPGAAERAPGRVTALAPGQPAYRILIAEDQHENQVLLTRLMSDIGLEVRSVGDGEQCVQAFQAWQPHLIWMDKAMPAMDGLEATRRIRQLPGGDKVKIVAVTASVFMEQQVELLASGVDGFVRKPYRAEEIYDALAEQLNLRYLVARDAEEAEDADRTLTPTMLSGLPLTLRADLRNAVERLDSARIQAAVKQVCDIDPALGRTLLRLADNFDYPAMLNALAETKE
jgi:PAS domain S-box-containing protein